MCSESWHGVLDMPGTRISRFHVITLHKSHHTLYLEKWNINLCKNTLFEKYTKFYDAFALWCEQIFFNNLHYFFAKNAKFPTPSMQSFNRQ